VEQPVFFVVLEGRTVGPYDRRTIVGMRIKKTLTSEHILIDSSGMQLTVADLIGRNARSNDFSPNRTGGFSIVQATYPANLVGVRGKGWDIPKFQDECEARVQGEVLRIAGRFRKGLRWKEGRIKLPLHDVVHARVLGSQVDLWLRTDNGGPLQCVSLELFTHDTAGELVEWLPDATPWPEHGDDTADMPVAPLPVDVHARALWVSVGSVALVVGVMLMVLMHRRF
jgi:hypothetical protein